MNRISQRMLVSDGVFVSACLFALVMVLATPAARADEASSPVYELRTYTTNEGKLEALQARFRNHTMALFSKHGMQNIAYWVPLDTPNTLIYLLEHQSREAAAESWKAFSADPQWQAVYQASIVDGRLVNNIVSVFMSKTDYSP